MLKHETRPSAEVLSALPIFPLPNVVLLPGMVLPLNVFERRYLDLVDHIREGSGHLGIPLLSPGYEADYEGRPPVEEVFGIGRLLSHERLADGRRFIRVEGLGRVRMLRELPPRHTFREVEVVALDEAQPRDLESLEILRAQIERIAALCPQDGEMIRSLLALPDARVLAYAMSALLPALDHLHSASRPARRCPQIQHVQRSLAAPTTDDRIHLLVERTGEALARMNRGAADLLN